MQASPAELLIVFPLLAILASYLLWPFLLLVVPNSIRKKTDRNLLKAIRLGCAAIIGFIVDELVRGSIIVRFGDPAKGGTGYSELQVLKWLDRGLSLLLIVAAGFAVLGLWNQYSSRLAESSASLGHRGEKLLVPVLTNLLRFIVFCVCIVAALGILGVNVGGVIAGLGIGGIVVALAAKDSVENIFGSVTILFDMPFALGDWVVIDKIEGVVEEINLRSTRIRTFEDTLITLPNSNLIKASVENYGARRTRRIKFSVKLRHSNEPSKVTEYCQRLQEFMDQSEVFESDRNLVQVTEYAEQTLGVLVQGYVVAITLAEESAAKSLIMLEANRLRQEMELTGPAEV